MKDKTVIGIVFYAGHHPADQYDYTNTGIGQAKCHGYVVALNNANNNYCKWFFYGKYGCCLTDADKRHNNYKNPDIDWCGYAWTQNIIDVAGGMEILNIVGQEWYPATWYAVVSYETDCNAPSKSSGCFLPSIGQMWKIH